MGYYMRFILTGEDETRLRDLEAGLKKVDGSYQITNVELLPYESGELRHGDALLGEVEINRPADPEELDELREEVEESGASTEEQQAVLSVVNQATSIIAVRVLRQGRNSEEVLEEIDPLWDWLFANRKGLLHADADGFYDASGLILEA